MEAGRNCTRHSQVAPYLKAAAAAQRKRGKQAQVDGWDSKTFGLVWAGVSYQ